MDSLYSLASYRYTLSPELIAQEAVHPHHDARLMIIDRETGMIETETTYRNLESHLTDDHVLFFNDSRVLPARIPLKNVQTIRQDSTHGSIENGEILFCQKLPNGDFEALVRPGSKFKIGNKILIGGGSLEVVSITEHGRFMRAHGISIESIMRTYGELPLPPYIEYTKEKEEDYQTVFAKKEGSVAAPTASLHFTEELMRAIPAEKLYLTLHVGLGTFQGIDVTDIRDYQIHEETIEVPKSIFTTIADRKKSGKIFTAVGTTVCRTLESLPYLWNSLDDGLKGEYDESTKIYWESLTSECKEEMQYAQNLEVTENSYCFSTSIYITPGDLFLLVDELITNFHLPESSLLVLVSAFMDREKTLAIYHEAIEKRYRFYSFGDGMYIRRGKREKGLVIGDW